MTSLQSEHAEKKKAYESAKMGHESKMAKLDTEVTGYKDEIAAAENRYHEVNCQIKLVDANIRRVTQVVQRCSLLNTCRSLTVELPDNIPGC